MAHYIASRSLKNYLAVSTKVEHMHTPYIAQ